MAGDGIARTYRGGDDRGPDVRGGPAGYSSPHIGCGQCTVRLQE
jgi:hypothetical protein